MKKLNRILSAAVAACMSLTMFAGAAELDSAINAPETETLTGTAYVFTPEGKTEKTFEYTVPVDATSEERTEIASDAAADAVGISSNVSPMSADSMARSSYFLADEYNVYIPRKRSNTTGEPILEDVKINSSGGYLQFAFEDISNCSTINVSINKEGAKFWQSEDVETDDSATVIFYGGGMYPNDTFYVDSNTYYDAYVSGDVSGSAYRMTIKHYR